MEKGRFQKPDLALLIIVAVLVFLGILILASVSASFSLQRFGTTFYFFNHQLLFGLLPGLALGFLFYLLPLETLKKWAFPALLFSILLLLLVFLPEIGTPEGAHRWIYFGSLSFQPSELLKLTFILYLASWLSSRIQKKALAEALLPFVFIAGVIALIMFFQSDISTLGLIGLTGIIMYFAAGTPLWHTPFFIGGGLGLLYLLIFVEPYRFSRIAVFLNPSLDPLGKGYQIKQALIGIGSGGITGTGLGLSFQKFGILPEPISDSIFAVFAEETGFVGAAVLIFFFLLFLWRSFIIAKNTQDLFSRLAALGIASWITLQAFINMGSLVGILPVTGIPLPFISYGGSALFVELIAMGILLNISKRV